MSTIAAINGLRPSNVNYFRIGWSSQASTGPVERLNSFVVGAAKAPTRIWAIEFSAAYYPPPGPVTPVSIQSMLALYEVDLDATDIALGERCLMAWSQYTSGQGWGAVATVCRPSIGLKSNRGFAVGMPRNNTSETSWAGNAQPGDISPALDLGFTVAVYYSLEPTTIS